MTAKSLPPVQHRKKEPRVGIFGVVGGKPLIDNTPLSQAEPESSTPPAALAFRPNLIASLEKRPSSCLATMTESSPRRQCRVVPATLSTLRY